MPQEYFSNRIFKVFDQNGDGEICIDEYSEVMKRLTSSNPEEAIDFLFRIFDSDGKCVCCICAANKDCPAAPELAHSHNIIVTLKLCVSTIHKLHHCYKNYFALLQMMVFSLPVTSKTR